MEALNWCLAASMHLITCNFTANDKPFLCVITEAFIRRMFLDLWQIMVFYVQGNTKKCSMLNTWDATYTTLYHVKHKNSVCMLVWFLVVSLKIVVISHPYSIWQAEDADRLYWTISQHWVVVVNTNEIVEKLVNLRNIFVQKNEFARAIVKHC